MRPSASVIPLLSALLALAGGCRRDVPRPLIETGDITLDLGTAGVVDGNRWAPLRLRVSNRGEDFRGTVTVRGVRSDLEGLDLDPVDYGMEVEIPGGGTTVREITIPVRPDGWTKVEVSFSAPGFQPKFRLDVPFGLPSTIEALIIGARTPDLSAIEREVGAHFAVSRPGEPRCRTSRISPERLPAAPRGYDPFGLVILWGSALGDAPQGAIEALAGWVESGGTLIAFPGPEWAGGIPQKLLELLGIAEVDPAGALPADPARDLEALAAGGYAREIRPAPGAAAVGGGIAVTSRRGAGRTFTFALRPGGDRFPTIGEAPLVHEVLRPAIGRTVSFAGSSPTALRAVERVVAEDLFAISGFGVPPRGLVALGILMYLAVGLIGPYIFFRRIRRPEWTFAAVLAAAVLATFAIYRYGLLSGMAGAEVEEVTVLRVHADGKAAEATSFLGLISPSVGRADLAPAIAACGPGALLQPLRGEIGFSFRGPRRVAETEISLRVDPAGREEPRPIPLRPNQMRFLRCDWRASLEGRISARFDADGALRIATLGKELLELIFIEGDRMGPASAIGSEEKRILPGELRANGSIPSSPRYQRLQQGPPLNRSLEDILNLVAEPWKPLQSGWSGPSGDPAEVLDDLLQVRRPPYLLAWTREGFFPAIPGLPAGKALTIIVFELPPKASG